ncbi:MAG: electron transfer flavoprotein subunit beta/FixA family protein [Candidatus Krumholzibacteria bacterium]|nr:electron transfer flavoprotein subunit beta/FixA family protein [Candidatus Krumholzibacteria bacterium]
MKIGVLVKNVPDTETKIRLTADKQGIETQGVKYVMNTYDEFAVEEALKIRERLQDGTTVTAITLGPERVVETLRTALAMGADEAIHVDDPAFEGGDSLTNARIIARVVEPMGLDLILGGKQGIDYDAAQTCSALAEALGTAQALIAVELKWSEDNQSLEVRRRIEGGDEIVHVKLPAVISCEKGLNEPRYASLPGIMKAKKKEIKKVDLTGVGLDSAEVGASGSATRVVGYSPLSERPECRILEGEPVEIVKELVRALREDAKVL